MRRFFLLSANNGDVLDPQDAGTGDLVSERFLLM